jgi:hypothetical protein
MCFEIFFSFEKIKPTKKYQNYLIITPSLKHIVPTIFYLLLQMKKVLKGEGMVGSRDVCFCEIILDYGDVWISLGVTFCTSLL